MKKSRLDSPQRAPGFDLPSQALLKNRTGKGYNMPRNETLRTQKLIDMVEEKKQ